MLSKRILLAGVIAVVAILGIPSLAHAAERIKVVTSFSIIGDLVRAVGGERVAVTTLIGPDADAHVFQPTPADSKSLLDASLIVINGLGFRGWADRLMKASGYKGARLVASKGLKALAADIRRNLRTPNEGAGLAIRVEDRTGDTPATQRKRQRVVTRRISC